MQLLRSALVENHFICFHVIDDDLAVAKSVIVSGVGSHEGDCVHHGLSEHSRICLSDGCEVIHISSTLGRDFFINDNPCSSESVLLLGFGFLRMGD